MLYPWKKKTFTKCDGGSIASKPIAIIQSTITTGATFSVYTKCCWCY